jgi:hypothetical protein
MSEVMWHIGEEVQDVDVGIMWLSFCMKRRLRFPFPFHLR